MHANRLRLVREAVEEGRLELIVTHVQIDEVSATPDDAKRRLLLELAHETNADTAGFVIGVSKLDMAAIGTDEENRLIEDVTAGNTRHAEDALLLSTAKRDGAVLVTNERRLANRCRTEGVPASTPEEFLERVAEEGRGNA